MVSAQMHKESGVYAKYEEEKRKYEERKGQASSSPSIVTFMHVDSAESSGKVKSKKYPATHPSQIKFNDAITDWIIEDSINFNVVDTPAFRNVIATADPYLNVQDRRTVANNISKKYVKVFIAEKYPLREVDTFITKRSFVS